MKTNYFFKLTVFLLIFAFLGCQTEEILPPEETLQVEDKNIQLEVTTASETPQFTNQFTSLTSKSKIGWSSKSNGDELVLDETRILVVTDSVGNKTFSARLYVPDTAYNVFYNVIAKLKTNGEMNEPIVLRYEIDKAYYTTYVSSDRKDAPFKGIINYYTIGGFIQGGTISGKDDFIVPSPNCPPILRDNNNTNTSSSSGVGGGSANGDGSNSSTGFNTNGGMWGFSYMITMPPSPGNVVYTPTFEVGQGSFSYREPGTFKRKATSKTGDCPEDELLIPINEEDDVILEENIEFASSFDEYPCQKKIVISAYSTTNPLTELFKDVFDSNDQVNVTFKVLENAFPTYTGETIRSPGGTPFDWDINLNQYGLENSTELDIVNTVIHEGVHATLYYFFNTGGFTSPQSNPTYAELVEAFSKHRAGLGGDHHPYMTNFVNEMAEASYTWALENDYKISDFNSYDTNPNDTINGMKEFMRDLSWSGLTDTSAFISKYPVNSAQSLKIKKTIQDETIPTNSNATPKGKIPCN